MRTKSLNVSVWLVFYHSSLVLLLSFTCASMPPFLFSFFFCSRPCWVYPIQGSIYWIMKLFSAWQIINVPKWKWACFPVVSFFQKAPRLHHMALLQREATAETERNMACALKSMPQFNWVRHQDSFAVT